MVILGCLFGHGGEGHPVAVVGEVEECHGDQEDPSGTVQFVAGDAGDATGDLADDGPVRVGHGDRIRSKIQESFMKTYQLAPLKKI